MTHNIIILAALLILSGCAATCDNPNHLANYCGSGSSSATPMTPEQQQQAMQLYMQMQSQAPKPYVLPQWQPTQRPAINCTTTGSAGYSTTTCN
jgi:Tfp pilus assembly protein PilP